MEAGGSITAVPSKRSSSKHSKFPISSGNFFNFEQPERMSDFRRFSVQRVQGRITRFLHRRKSIQTRLGM
ncbi:hypothetical protein LguiB_020623 [Lonicera macranthoides]